MTAAAPVAESAVAGDCLRCRNDGLLPAANGTVDKATVLQCCRACISALFLDGLAGWLFVLDATKVRFA